MTPYLDPNEQLLLCLPAFQPHHRYMQHQNEAEVGNGCSGGGGGGGRGGAERSLLLNTACTERNPGGSVP